MLWAHARPQRKLHLDRFSRVCTDDRGVSLYFTLVCLFPLKFPLPMLASRRHVICRSLRLPEPGTQMAIDNLIVSAVFAGLTSVTD